MSLQGGEKILDIGSGLGLYARDMAKASGCQVVCVEGDPERIERAQEMAATAAESALLDLRRGDALELPLAAGEWEAFDVVHCRFVLEHVVDPQRVLAELARAVRPGGRVILMGDDHEVLRLWPAIPAVDELWRALIRAFQSMGQDPFVGRKLVALAQGAGLRPLRADSVPLGGCAGDAHWDVVLARFTSVLESVRAAVLTHTAIRGELFDEVLEALQQWGDRPDATICYQACWAEAVRER